MTSELTRADSLLNQGAFAQQPDDALRVAALEAIEHLPCCSEKMYGRGHTSRCWFGPLQAALDGAPYEPSEEMVQRVAKALMSDAVRASTEPTWDAIDAARAALRAAFSPGGSLSGTGQQQTDR